MQKSESGTALLWLFAGVALFGAIGWVMLSERQTGMTTISGASHEAAGIALRDCANAIQMGEKRLNARGCHLNISYRLDGQNAKDPSGVCSIFHKAGGGVARCDGQLHSGYCSVNLDSLQIGQSCQGLIYIGKVGSRRIYTHQTDASAAIAWNNGNTSTVHVTNNTSTDGMVNTNKLIALVNSGQGHIYRAAQLCRSFGPEWFLPSIAELQVMRSNRTKGLLAGTITEGGEYWSSNDTVFTRASALQMVGTAGAVVRYRSTPNRVRCVRSD